MFASSSAAPSAATGGAHIPHSLAGGGRTRACALPTGTNTGEGRKESREEGGGGVMKGGATEEEQVRCQVKGPTTEEDSNGEMKEAKQS